MIEISGIPIDCKYLQELENGLRENLFSSGKKAANMGQNESGNPQGRNFMMEHTTAPNK